MDIAKEILDAIEIIVDKKIQDNTAQIYRGVCKSITTTTCTLTINGKDNTVKYYGGTPIVGTVYQVFVPSGDMSTAFIIVPGTTGGAGESGVSSVNGKTGTVILNANDVGALPNTTVIPTKTSELDNDSGFIDDSALSGYAKTTDIPTQTSQLTNNSGFITANDVPVKSVDGQIGAVVTNAVKTTSQSLTDTQKTQARTNIGAGTSSFDGNYESLSNKPTIPTQTSQLENNSGFITASDVPVKSVNSKTGNVVLTADDVGALPDTTVIPVVNDAILDIQRNGVSVGTFTANASTDKAINITVPTKASDVGAVSTSDVTTTLGTSTTKVPSEKAVSDAMIHQLQVTITYNSTTKTYSADKTYNEIKTAYDNKYLIYCNLQGEYYSFSKFGTNVFTFVSDNASDTFWYVLAIQINVYNKVATFGTNLFMPNGIPNTSGEYAPGVGAVSAVCWYLRPASDGSTTYYLWEYRENGAQVTLGTNWASVIIDPNSYNLNIYYNGKVYEKAFFNAPSASEAPLTGKFIRMDYENGDIVCRVLSIDAYNFFMSGSDVIFSEQILKVTTTTI